MNAPSTLIARARERLREETATAILDAAEAVIGEDGLHAARMERIATRAGVSVGTLYNHFENKDAILDALRTSRIALLRALMEESFAKVEGLPLRDGVLALLETMRSHGRRHGRFLAALMAERLGPSTLRPPAEARSEVLRRAREVVERGAARGELRADAPDLLADALSSLARLVLVRAVEGPCDDDELTILTDLFLRGASR